MALGIGTFRLRSGDCDFLSLVWLNGVSPMMGWGPVKRGFLPLTWWLPVWRYRLWLLLKYYWDQINIWPAEGSLNSTRLLLSQLKMTHDLSTWVPLHIQKHAQSLCSLLSQPVAVWRNVPFRSDGRVVSSGEFPVGMSHDEGGVAGGGIVRLDLNPLALVAARPQDKLACGIWTYKNATWTFHKNCLKSFFFTSQECYHW